MVPPLLVIDGQQRLTTLSLLILALSDEVAARAARGEPAEVPATLAGFYLLNANVEGDLRRKLRLTYGDRETLDRLVDGLSTEAAGVAPSRRVVDNLGDFRRRLDAADGDELVAVWRGLGKLMMIDVSLDRDRDDPQLIFESLNSTGLDLSQADLIRNYVLMGLDLPLQQSLFEGHWRPMEAAFGGDAYAEHFDRFVRHYLTMKLPEIPNISRIYGTFKQHCPAQPAGRGGRGGPAPLRQPLRRRRARPRAGREAAGGAGEPDRPPRRHRRAVPARGVRRPGRGPDRDGGAAAGRGDGRGVRRPPHPMRHPDEHAEQDVRGAGGADRQVVAGRLYREPRRGPAAAARIAAVPPRRGGPGKAADQGRLRPQDPPALPGPPGESRPQGAGFAAAVQRRARPAAEPRLVRAVAGNARRRLAKRPRSTAAHAWEPDAYALQQRAVRPPVRRQARPRGARPSSTARCGSTARSPTATAGTRRQSSTAGGC